MTDTNILFESFSVTPKPALGGGATLFGGSIGAERTSSSSIITSMNNCNSAPNSSISGGVNVIPSTNTHSFNTGIINNGSSNSIRKMSPTTVNSPVNTGSSTITSNSSSSSNNNNKQPPNDNGHATNNSSGTSSNNVGSSHTSPNNLDLGNRSPPQDLWRSTSSGGLATIHGLDLSKPPSLAPPSCLSGAELIKKEAHCLDGNDDSASATTGLDLSKPELPSPGTGNYRRPSDLAPSPFTNGVHSDPPTPQGAGHAPSRSMSSGSGADNGEEAERSGSPFGADSVLNDRSAEGFTNGDTSVPLSLSSSLLGAQPDRPGYMKSSPKFADPYSAKAFDEASPPPPLKFKDPYSLSNPPPPLFDHSVPKPPSSDALHKLPTNLSSKYKDSCIAARLADNTFVKPLDSYSKLLEGYGHNARNNNNNNNTSNNNNTGPKPDLHDSPFGPIPESYAKHIENLANGYKTESSPLGKDGLLFKGDPPLPPSSASSIVNFSKREGSLTNGIGAGFGVTKSESGTPASAHSPGSSSSSLPSILNFSTNHLRGMAAGEGGLAGYLSSYSMGGPLPGSLSGSGGGSGGDSRPPGGGSGQPGGGSEGGLARASPNNKLACRFCGKTFSQAGYIKAHERLHTGEKPFACSVCGKRFSDPSNWKKHERVHANNKKAPGTGGHVTGLDHSDSKVCGRTFAQSGSFRMHERRHMTDSIQRCHICYNTFSSWQELQRHMATHPQVTQAIMEFEEGNQGLMERLNSDLGGPLSDGGIGQLGHPDPDGPPGHSLLQGLYPGPGQLPPFSSILPFRPHPGAPPAFPPTFPSAALGLSLPVTSHADLLTKHPIFGAMNMALAGPQHPHHPPPPPPPPPHHHHTAHHPPHHTHQQPDHLQHHNNGNSSSSSSIHPHHHRNSPHPCHHDNTNPASGGGRGLNPDSGTDVVSTTSSGSRRGSTVGDGVDAGLGGTLGGSGSAKRSSSRSYTPEDARSDSEPTPCGKDDKESSSAFGRCLSSDDGLSPDEENGGGGGHHRKRSDGGHQGRYHNSRKLGSNAGSDDDDMGGRMRRLSDNDDDDDNRPDDDDDTDIDDRYAADKGSYSRNRRYSDERDMERGRDRDRGDKMSRNRSRSFERERDRGRRDLISRDRKRSHSGNLKGSSMDYMEDDDLLRDRRDGSPRNHRGSPKLKDGNGCANGDSNGTNNDDDFLDPNITGGGSSSGGGGGGSGHDSVILRPPKRHIERQNLNTRMIPSSRKQRHPMRRFSSAGSEQESPQSSTPSTTIGHHNNTPSHLPVSSTTMEATLERNDAELVTFLLKEGSVYKCIHCHMIFEDASLFLLHNGFHAHDEPFRCVVCHHVCKDRIDFNCHLTSHIK